MKIPNISQSLLKAYVEYYDDNIKGCGLYLWKQCFERKNTGSSRAKDLGIYFEYLCTGYVREGDNRPAPKLSYKGTSREALAADYQRVEQSVALYHKMIKAHNVEILSVGEYITHDNSSGLLDIKAKVDGEECIIDLKYSGFFDDKWSPYGWHTESLPMKSNLLLQPIHYKYLMRKTLGVDNMPFYFWIFNSKDPEQAKIIKVNIDEAHITLHEETYIPKMKKYVQYHYMYPEKLEARPGYIRCLECPFYEECDKKVTVPHVEEVYY